MTNLPKLDATIACMQELATALIDIRDKSFASYMLIDEDSYRYGMEIRARAERGLDHLLKLRMEICNE